MPISPRAKEAIEWYSNNRFIYQALAKKVESIVREILKAEKIDYHSITSRAKAIESYRRKASDERYRKPISEIFDMAGIRVITYTNADAKHVHEIIKKTFELDPKQSIDKSQELGVDKMGYRSIHCVGTLGKERIRLPENSIFKDKYFEIQIRSILQHAWAEFEHDRNYKFGGVLPKDMRRKLSIIAGRLESIDQEFDDISIKIDRYSAEVEKQTELGTLSLPINSTSLKAYLSNKFRRLVEKGILKPNFRGYDTSIIEELKAMGIDSLDKLDRIIPVDFEEKLELAYASRSFIGLVRNILFVHDIGTYFKKAWQKNFTIIMKGTLDFLREYGVEIDKYTKEVEGHDYRLIIGSLQNAPRKKKKR